MTLLEILGPAAVPTIICLVVGLLLLLIEMFLPGFGVPGALGLLSLIAVIVMQLCWGSPAAAAYISAGVLVIIVVAVLLVIRSLQKGRLSRSFIVLDEQIDANSTSLSDAREKDNIGKTGITITPLRPAGIAEFDGKRLDVMTNGTFVDAGVSVVITDVQGLHILVEAEKK